MPMSSHVTHPKQNLSPKLLTTIVASVLGLHIGVGLGLMNMPALTVRSLKITPPLEVSFVQPSKPVASKPIIESEPMPKVEEKIAPKPVSNPIPKSDSKPSKSQPIAKVQNPLQTPSKPQPQPEPQKETKANPIAKQVDKDIQRTAEPNKRVVKQPTTSFSEQQKPVKLIENNPEPFAHLGQTIDQQAILAKQAKDAEQITQQKAQVERAEQARQAQIREQMEGEQRAEIARQQAQVDRQKTEHERLAQIAQQQAEKQRLAQEKLAREQADKARIEQERAEREQGQREKAERERAQKQQAEKTAQAKKDAQNSEPVSFGNGDADWRSKPNLNFSGNLARIILDENLTSIGVRLNVSSSGSVTAVSITRSSGNSQVDNAVKQRLFSAKLKPFVRNGVAVAGVGNLTVNLN